MNSSIPNVSRLFSAAAIVAAVNAAVLVFLDSYDFRLGPVHLVAHGLFKPLLYVSGAVLAAVLFASGNEPPRIRWSPAPWITTLVVLALYLPTTLINPTTHNDWTHQASTSTFHSPLDLLRLFVWRQPDGFYRPMTFVSLTVDHWLFGERVWGYHLQNVALHAANAFLVCRLGIRFGLDAAAARWASLLFGVASVNYEPVLWPGARFDLLAGLFTLGALVSAIRYLDDSNPRRLAQTLALFALGVLSKESAYAFAPLFFLLAWTRSRLRQSIPALGATVAVTLVMLSIRVALFGGLGGYPDEVAGTPHFVLKFSTIASFFTRALPAPLLLLNTDAGLGWYPRLGALAFAAWAVIHARTPGGTLRQNATLLAAALVAAIPAANLVDWIGPIAHNVRYVYLTSVWIFLLLAASARYGWALGLLAGANIVGVIHNLLNYEWID